MQMLKNISYIKYLKNDFNCIEVLKNSIYKLASSMQVMRDNQVALSFVKNAHNHERSKHINVIYYYVRDLCKSN